MVGIITAMGDSANKVDGISIGQRVGIGPLRQSCQKCKECANQNQQLCEKQVGLYNSKDYQGYPTYGGFGNKIRVDSRFVYPIPDSLTSELAAPLLCAGLDQSNMWK